MFLPPRLPYVQPSVLEGSLRKAPEVRTHYFGYLSSPTGKKGESAFPHLFVFGANREGFEAQLVQFPKPEQAILIFQKKLPLAWPYAGRLDVAQEGVVVADFNADGKQDFLIPFEDSSKEIGKSMVLFSLLSPKWDPAYVGSAEEPSVSGGEILLPAGPLWRLSVEENRIRLRSTFSDAFFEKAEKGEDASRKKGIPVQVLSRAVEKIYRVRDGEIPLEETVGYGLIARVKPSNIQASSRMEVYGRVFTKENAIDGDPQTAWAEGVSGPGVGEWLILDLGRRRYLTAVSVIPGCRESVMSFRGHGAPTKLRIEFSEGQALTLIESGKKWKILEGSVEGLESAFVRQKNEEVWLFLGRAVEGVWARLTLMEVRKGMHTNDTCVAEFSCYESEEAP